MIQRLSHTTVYVLDQDAARDFYVNKLGFEVRMDASMDNGFRWLTVGSKGSRMEFGILSISHCWTGFRVMVRSTGRVLLSTAVRCARFLGAADWAKSDR